MESRRGVLKTFVTGAAATAVPTTAAVEFAFGDGFGLFPAEADAGAARIDGPAPWWLLAPLEPGFRLGLGWFVGDLSPIRQGATILTLVDEAGQIARIHLCAREGSGRGLARTALLDLVLMDGRNGDAPTPESLGRVVLGIAQHIAKSELGPDGDLRPLSWLQPHDDRVSQYGAEALMVPLWKEIA